MWCKTCNKIVCMHCIPADHDCHSFQVLEKSMSDIEADVQRKFKNLELDYEQNSHNLLEKYSEMEEKIQNLMKLESVKKEYQTIRSQIVEQQKKTEECMEKFSAMKLNLVNQTCSDRQNMLIDYHQNLDKHVVPPCNIKTSSALDVFQNFLQVCSLLHKDIVHKDTF